MEYSPNYRKSQTKQYNLFAFHCTVLTSTIISFVRLFTNVFNKRSKNEIFTGIIIIQSSN